LLSLAASTAAAVPEPLRLESLKRCGDLLQSQSQDWCLTVRGLGQTTPPLKLGAKVIPADTIQREGENLRLRLDSADYQSGPLWLQDGPRASNAAWLTLRNSHVQAARADEVAKNMDGLTTYVDLVSVLIEETVTAVRKPSAWPANTGQRWSAASRH
jgi:hypothetical protein